jgi:hypothetical protein
VISEENSKFIDDDDDLSERKESSKMSKKNPEIEYEESDES